MMLVSCHKQRCVNPAFNNVGSAIPRIQHYSPRGHVDTGSWTTQGFGSTALTQSSISEDHVAPVRHQSKIFRNSHHTIR